MFLLYEADRREPHHLQNEPHPVKRTEKKYKDFPVGSQELPAAFQAARQRACFSMGIKRPDQLTYDGDTQKVSYGYDELGRVTTRTAECGAAAGKLTSSYTYVDGGFSTNSTTPLVKKIAQNGISFEYEYDSRGNIVSEKRGNLTTTYTYDALGQLIRVNDPHENATWVYSYDRGGNITSKAKYAYAKMLHHVCSRSHPAVGRANKRAFRYAICGVRQVSPM